MRAAVIGMVLLCGIAQGAEPPDADRPLGEDRKAAVVAQAKQKVVELEKQRVAAVRRQDGGLISALVNDIRLAKIELKEALKRTVEGYASETLEKQQKEQVTTDTTTLKGAMQQARAWKQYSAQMWMGPLYNLPAVGGEAPGQILGNIDLLDEAAVTAALIRGGAQNNDKALATALKAKYRDVAGPFRRANVDKPFAYLGGKMSEGWRKKDDQINFPGSPEDLAARVNADSNALDSIRDGKTDYLSGMIMNTQGSLDVHSGQAVLEANATNDDLKTLSDADKNRLGPDDSNTKLGKDAYKKLLTDSLMFSKTGPYKRDVRMANFDAFMALKLNTDDVFTTYKGGEALIDESIRKIKSAYSIWDSIDHYSFDQQGKMLSVETEDVNGMAKIQKAQIGQKIVGIGAKEFTNTGNAADFPKFVLDQMGPSQKDYNYLTGILGENGSTVPRMFPDANLLQAEKYKQVGKMEPLRGKPLCVNDR